MPKNEFEEEIFTMGMYTDMVFSDMAFEHRLKLLAEAKAKYDAEKAKAKTISKSESVTVK